MNPRQTESPSREAETLDAPMEAPLQAPAEAPLETSGEELARDDGSGSGSDYRVILYDDDFHSYDEVVEQLVKATAYPFEQCVHIMMEAHHKGRAICYRGARAKCQRVTRVLREIRLQCEVDCD